MDPFLGEIRLMGGTYPPKGWAFCNGQILAINTNQALFSLLGTTYGGDGRTTFALPDLRSRVVLGVGQGAGLQNYNWGQRAGTESVTLSSNEMPAHTHPLTGTVKEADEANSNEPAAPLYPATSRATQYSTGTPNASLNGSAISGTTGSTGGNQPHENRQPVLAMNYCIATQGIFPSRS